MSIKNKIKSILPFPILIPLQKLHAKISDRRRLSCEIKLIDAQPELHRIALERVRAKHGPINVVFFALMDSVWKYDVLYRLMEKDERFNPVILVCPVVNYSRENMLINMDKCYDLFKSRGYNVISSYDESIDRYLDVRKELNPDVIFYTNPYKGLIDDRYYITEFPDTLTCYTSYFFTNTPEKELNDTLLHNLVWKRYVENEFMIRGAKANNRNHGINCINCGYPGFDVLIHKYPIQKDPWKIMDQKNKRIIWAPHHTIDFKEGWVFYSTFLMYHEFFFSLADRYSDSIQICFKPHPLLKNKLYMKWGREKTDEYYKKWESLPNGMLNDSAYEDLFMTSDAVIHDCGSFIAEYLYTKKPAMYLSNGMPFNEQYNEMAQKCLDNYYIGRNESDIESFIQNIINDVDPLKNEREEFVRAELMPPNGKLASENIIDDLSNELLQ